MTMSAGRCCPLVTLTMSPTATQWAGATLQQHEEGENEIKKETTVHEEDRRCNTQEDAQKKK